MKLWLLILFLHCVVNAEDSDVISEADVLAFEKSLERQARSSNIQHSETTDAEEQENVRNSRETTGGDASTEITGTSRHHKNKKMIRRRVTKQVSHRIRGRPRHRFGSTNGLRKSFRKQFETSSGQLLPSRRQSVFIRPEAGLHRPLTQTSLTQSITVNQLNRLPARPLASKSHATRHRTSFHRSGSGFIRKTTFGGTASLDSRFPQNVPITPITSKRTNNRLLLHDNSMNRSSLNLLPPPLLPVFPLPNPSRSRTSHRVHVPTRVEPRLFRPLDAAPQPIQLIPPPEGQFIPKWKTNKLTTNRRITLFNTDERPTPRVDAPQLEKGLDEALLLEAERNIEQAVLEAVEENRVRNRPLHTHSGSALRQTASPVPHSKRINSHRFNRLRGQLLSSTASIDDIPATTTPVTTTTEEVTQTPEPVPSRPMNSNENKSKEDGMHRKNLQSGTSSERFSTGQIRSEKRPNSRRRLKLLRPPVFHPVENVTESAFVQADVSNEHEHKIHESMESTVEIVETTKRPRTRSTTRRTTAEPTTVATTESSTSTTTEQSTTTVTQTTPETTSSTTSTTTTTTTTTPVPNTTPVPISTTTVMEITSAFPTPPTTPDTTPPTTSSAPTTIPPTTAVATTIPTTTTTTTRLTTTRPSTTTFESSQPLVTIPIPEEDNLASVDDFAIISEDLNNITDSTSTTSTVAPFVTIALPLDTAITTLAPPPRNTPRAQTPSTDSSAERISDEIERNLVEGNQGPAPPTDNSTSATSQSTRRGPPGIVPPGVRLPEIGPPGSAPPSDSIVNQLNQADDFMELARQLRIARRKKTVARRKRAAERDRMIVSLRRSQIL